MASYDFSPMASLMTGPMTFAILTDSWSRFLRLAVLALIESSASALSRAAMHLAAMAFTLVSVQSMEHVTVSSPSSTSKRSNDFLTFRVFMVALPSHRALRR